jgi:hypothetical protein
MLGTIPLLEAIPGGEDNLVQLKVPGDCYDFPLNPYIR